MSASNSKRRGRYGMAKKTVVDGHTFDSAAEARRYSELRLMERAGEIMGLEVHVSIPIVIAGIEIRYKSGRQMRYEADFEYVDSRSGKLVYEDCKGHRTEVYKIKRALLAAMGIVIVETQ